MIESIKLENWKSFDELEFKPESMNIIIGANASGKSNLIEALELIQKIVMRESKDEIEKIRGGIKNFKKFGSDEFKIEIKASKDKEKDTVFLSQENMEITCFIYEKEEVAKDELDMLIQEAIPRKIYLSEDRASLNIDSKKMKELNLRIIEKYKDEFPTRLLKVLDKNSLRYRDYIPKLLQAIRVIDSIPREIRGQSRIAEDNLKKDCSNLVSYVANLKNKKEVEQQVLVHLNKLTETNIENIEFKILGDNDEYAQLYIAENGHILHSDIVSDGTLRFIAILVALLTQKEGSILAIEEIDNGIAPAKVKLLLDIIDDISYERKFDVVLTTHNTALLRYISKKLLDFVFIAHRKDNGASTLTRIKDIERLPKMMSHGDIGELMESGKIYDFLNTKSGDPNEA